MAIDPAQADARGNLATLLVRTGRHAEAVRELRQLVADDPENVAALTNLGVALIEQGRAAEARRYLEEALRLAPGLPQALDALRAMAARRRPSPFPLAFWPLAGTELPWQGKG